MSEGVGIRSDAITFGYLREVPVVNGITFSASSGERIGLIGPNGSGKTTLLALIAGIFPPTQGSILIGDDDAHAVRPGLVGFLMQSPDDQLFMPTVGDDVRFGPVNLGSSAREAQQIAREALQAAGMAGYENRHPHSLSGGEKRMAALAAVLAMNPAVLLLDEPSSDLDHRNRRRLIEVINERRETRIIASHDLEFLLETTDRCLLLDGGAVVADDTTKKVLSDRALLDAHGLELPWSFRGEHVHAVMPDDPHHARHHGMSLPHYHGKRPSDE